MLTSMPWMLILYGLVPLIAFVLVDLYAGMKWAVAAAVVLAIADIFVTRHLTGQWDPGAVVAAVLILGLGMVTLRWRNPAYIKFQPVVMSGVMAAFLAYLQFFGGGVMQRYAPALVDQLPPDMQMMVQDPAFLKMMDGAVTGLIGVLLLHGAAMAYAALKLSNGMWLAIRAFGFWALLAVYLMGTLLVMLVASMT